MAAMSQRRNQNAELSSTIAGAMGVKAVVVAPRAVFADRDPSHTTLASMDLVPAKIDQLAAKYADARQYMLDGISIEYPDWHCNVRPSNTEPLLRLNLEAKTPELMAAKRDEVIAVIRS